MIFRAIEIESWGCFTTPLAIGPLAEGVNVIHGPNATGKSTLASALARGLFDRHKVSGSDAEALRPWGRDVGPRIAIEFAHAGVEYRLEKRFLVGPSSRLLRREGSGFALVAEGEAADERVRAILSATPAGKGLSKSSNWGIAQVLWAPQGELRLDETSRDAEVRLRDAIGASTSSPEGERLERRIDEEWSKIFTPKGQLKRGQGASRLVTVEADRRRVEDELARACADLAAFEEASRKLEALRDGHASLAKDQQLTKDRLVELRARATAYLELVAKEEKIASEESAARDRAAAIDRRVRALADVRAKRRELETSKGDVAAKLPALEAEVGARAGEVNRLAARLAETRAALDDLESMRIELDDARRFRAASEKEATLRPRIDRIDELDRRIAASGSRPSTAPSRDELSAIGRAAAARDQARAVLDASALRLEITAEAPVEIEAPEQRRLAPGESVEVRGTPEVSIRIRGVGIVRARGPSDLGASPADALRKADETLSALMQPFGATDVESLEKRARERESSEATVQAMKLERDTLLAGSNPATLRSELDRAHRETVELRARRPDWTNSAPHVESMEEAYTKHHASLVPLVRALEDEHKTAARSHADAEQSWFRERTKFESLPAQIQREIDAERRLVDEDGLDEAARAAACEDAALAWRAATAAARIAKEERREFGGDPAGDVVRTEQSLERLDDAERRAFEAVKLAEGALNDRADEGAYSTVARLEEQRARLADDEARERRRADALECLRSAIAKARAEVVDLLVRPIRARVEKSLPRIVGGEIGSLEFGADFRPRAIRPEPGGDAVGLDALSGGTAEQLHFATRLALAEVLSEKAREVIVLDDPLVFTDAERMVRIAEVLAEAGARCQILLFTCHPERYRGLPVAREFDLAAIRRADPAKR
ncbi:MAG: AAA family ATPase [Planctomycetes bacterium]|nr:AAA family ATPase [Planctomycetota bacterium]MBI3848392.1 AAA family ATPase [Planctomycetota bacterium]